MTDITTTIEALPLLTHEQVLMRGGIITMLPAVPEAWHYRSMLSGIYKPVQTLTESEWLTLAADRERIPVACINDLDRAKLVAVLASEQFFALPRWQRMNYRAAVVALAASRYIIATRTEAAARGFIAPLDEDAYTETGRKYLWAVSRPRPTSNFIITSYEFNNDLLKTFGHERD